MTEDPAALIAKLNRYWEAETQTRPGGASGIRAVGSTATPEYTTAVFHQTGAVGYGRYLGATIMDMPASTKSDPV